MKTKTVALVMTVVLCAAVFVACGSPSEPAQSQPVSISTAVESTSAPASSESVPATTESEDEIKLLVDQGIVWGEGPRWHDDMLYFSDIMGQKVMRTDLEGNAETVVEVPGMPSGLGFLPDGRLLIVSGQDGTLYTHEADGLVEYANIYAGLEGTQGINDMVVDENGNAYVGCYGYDITQYAGGTLRAGLPLSPPITKL